MKNKGFSLVEVIIVVAILSVLGAVSMMGISLITSKPVEECARNVKIALENARTTTMGKLTASISFYKDAEGNIMAEEMMDGVSEVTRIGKSSLTIKYKLKSQADLKTLGTDKLTLSFDRSSGSLKALESGTYAGEIVEKIVVSNGNKEMEVCIEWLTGRVSIN